MLSVLPDAIVTTLGTSVTIHVLANDSGGDLTVTSFSNPAHGNVIFNSDQSFTYTPTAGFVGTDSFAYTVRDAQGTPSGAEVTITVAPNDGATRATDDYIEMIAGGNAIIPVLSNDLTATGSLRLIAISVPGHGAANVLASQSIRYVPQSGFVGIDSFTYTVIDQAGTTTSAIVTVKVLAENRPPLAKGDAFTLEAGQTTVLAILGNDSDADGDPLQVVSYTMPSHGSLAFNPDKTFSYTPDAGYQGADQFTYTIRDNRGASASASVLLTIVETAEQPTAADDHVVTEAGVPVAIDVLGNDGLPAGQEIRIVAVTLPFKGKLVFNPDGTITYTPNMGFVGFDDFTYTIGNDRGGTSKATVVVEVQPASVTESYANGYGYRRRIVMPAQAPDAGIVEDVVVMVSEQGTWLKSAAHGGKVTYPDGADIRFEDMQGNKLDHEIESYDPESGTLLAWVRLPSWALASQIQIFLFYGKSSVAQSEANAAGVWQSYLVRWRFPDGSDATGQGRNLVPEGVTSDTLLGTAARFDGAGSFSLPGTPWLEGLSAITMQALVKSDTSMPGTSNGILVQGTPDSTDWRAGITLSYVGQTSSGTPNVVHAKVHCSDGVAFALSSANRQTVDRQLIHSAWSAGDAPELYLDGVRDSLSRSEGRSGATSVTGPLYLGAGWEGLIDEVRIIDRKLPADWVAFEARNMLTPELSYGVAQEETTATAEAPLVAVPFVATTTAGKAVDLDVLSQSTLVNPGVTLSLVNLSQPQNGIATVVEGSVRYTPNAGFTGDDQFTYTLGDGAISATGRIAVTVATVQSPSTPSHDTGVSLPPALRTVNVSNGSQLAAALSNAQAGDHIVLANGSYGGGFMISGKSGTAEKPIVIRAANLLKATLGGEVQTCLTVSGGAHVWVHGLNFTGYILNGISFSGQRHKFLRCRFADYGRSTYWTRSHGLTTNGRTDFCEIGYCRFENPRTFHTWNSGDPQWPQWRWGFRAGGYLETDAAYDLTITRCHFANFPNTISSNYASDQSEGIEVAATGLFVPTRMVVSYCLFENMPWSEGAMIDCKGGDQGVVEYCTFVTSNMRAIDLRQCRQWTVRHNWCENTTGISVYGPDHILIGNKIVGVGSILLLRGNGDNSRFGNATVSNCLLRCNVGPLRIGLDYSSAPLTYLPTGVQVDGHDGTVSIQSGSGVSQNPGYSCPPNQAFKLTAAEVGPGVL
ncbi:MAG TPA: DUF2341 domain-containing protein [Hyphomonas sp.]|nr:DUF2341 domain-containing protein [Geminicoccaceae bacterium]HRX72867.1 DUF2341 domain-containing protein [Hyphomonas sp.]